MDYGNHIGQHKFGNVRFLFHLCHLPTPDTGNGEERGCGCWKEEMSTDHPGVCLCSLCAPCAGESNLFCLGKTVPAGCLLFFLLPVEMMPLWRHTPSPAPKAALYYLCHLLCLASPSSSHTVQKKPAACTVPKRAERCRCHDMPKGVPFPGSPQS